MYETENRCFHFQRRKVSRGNPSKQLRLQKRERTSSGIVECPRRRPRHQRAEDFHQPRGVLKLLPRQDSAAQPPYLPPAIHSRLKAADRVSEYPIEPGVLLNRDPGQRKGIARRQTGPTYPLRCPPEAGSRSCR